MYQIGWCTINSDFNIKLPNVKFGNLVTITNLEEPIFITCMIHARIALYSMCWVAKYIANCEYCPYVTIDHGVDTEFCSLLKHKK